VSGLPFADLWEGIARARGDAPAQVQADRSISWAELDRRANGVAAALLDAGVSRQDKVANYLHNCPEYLESVFATVKAGLVPVNTNYRYGPTELAYLWNNADAVAVVFHGTFAETVDRVRHDVPSVRRWLWVDDGSGPCPAWASRYEREAGAGRSMPVAGPWGRTPDDLVFIYTGGTTGMPKGVMWRQGDLAQGAGPAGTGGVDEVVAALPEEPPVMVPACPLMHGTGLISAFGNLRQGGRVVTLADRTFDAVELLDAVEREGVGSIAIVGDVFARPIVAALDADPGRWDLSSLRVVISSGVMWSEPVKQALLAHVPHATLFDSLGSSEAVGIASSVSTAGGVTGTASFKVGDRTKVFTEDGREVAPGSGEAGLLGRSGAIPLGYYKDEVKTDATFRILDGQRYVLPGDWATVDHDGTVRLLGRGSVCINTGGEKVFPEEVEEALKEHPDVTDVAVVGVPDETWGEAICALVEPRDGVPVDEAALIAHVKERLARYKAPKRVLEVETVARAANGKLDYQGLRRQAAERLGVTTNA
jgi:acyl-CoA synthetase (AMP-forming)/AMP-acid ligase II